MELALTLEVLLVICFIVLGVLIGAYFVILLKNKKKSNTEIKHSSHKEEIEKNNNKRTTENVLDFMEFDEIKDNMIIRKDRKQYVMIVKCKGVNYDLMSEEEKVSVEAGFVQFLNTLRFPIQLYVQTTSLNLRDIILEIKKPGRDPRDEGMKPILRTDVLKIEDIKEGMVLKGTVRNVVDFGAFVDIGIKNDGLVHKSQMSNKFVKDPMEIVSVGDVIDVKVIGIDLDKGRVSLSMKL